MNRTEFATIAAALQTYFPRYSLLPNSEAMELWYQELRDIHASVLQTALRKWVATEKWPPSIAELRALCAELTQGKAPEWGDGWEEVRRAIHRYGWAREKEALESMSPLTREVVKRFGWMEICCNENPDTLRAQFRQIYEIQGRRAVEDRMLPGALKDMIAQIGTGIAAALPERGDGT